jgi:hypothetical protein
LIPSDEEGDAVPLDDEFAMALERRPTGTGSDEPSLARRSTSGTSMKGTISSRESRSTGTGKGKGKAKGKRKKEGGQESAIAKLPHSPSSDAEAIEPPDMASIEVLRAEEEQARIEEEEEIERKRLAAQTLARSRGLSVNVEDEVGYCHLSITFHGDQSNLPFLCHTHRL